MRLGFISARKVTIDGDRIRTDAGLGRLIDGLAERSESITVALSPMLVPHPLHDHDFAIDRRDLLALPSMPSLRGGVLQHRGAMRVIREVEERSDVVIVQLPFAAPTALLGAKRPRLYHVCADVLSITRGSNQYTGALYVAALGTAFAIDRLHRVLFARKDARIVTNGSDLLRRYQPAPGIAVVSSAIREEEIMSVVRERKSDRFRILFVGYLRPEKGFDVLIEAFERLLEDVPQAELMIVGPEQVTQREVAAALQDRVRELVDAGRVQLAGAKSFGPELFRCFADADVLALTSVSEGTPRVLIEARAFGCPVVAARVGGVPTSVEDGVDGLLVPPRDAVSLTGALRRIAIDRELVARIVAGGIARARRTTVEAFASAMIGEAQLLCTR